MTTGSKTPWGGGTHLLEPTYPPHTPHAAHGRAPLQGHATKINFHLINRCSPTQPENSSQRLLGLGTANHLAPPAAPAAGHRASLARGREDGDGKGEGNGLAQESLRALRRPNI